MRALLRKELLPFVAPGLVGTVLFTGLWIVVFDVESAFLDSPAKMLAAVAFLAVNVGGLLGYAQVAVEREGSTLSYLVHREVALRRLLAAKCVAGWVLLAMVIELPVVLCAAIESRTSPLGAILQWSRVWEIGLGGLIALPAHAIGVLSATLRPAFGFRVTFAAFAAGGLGGVAAFFLEHPIAGPGASQAMYALGCVVIAAVLYAGALRRAERMEDAERAASPAIAVVVLGVFAVLIAAPGHGVASIVQDAVVDYARLRHEPRTSLVWHPERGAGTADEIGIFEYEVRSPEGELLASLDLHQRIPNPEQGWIWAWRPDGSLGSVLQPRPWPDAPRREAPAIGATWESIDSTRVDTDRNLLVSYYQNRSNGTFVVMTEAAAEREDVDFGASRPLAPPRLHVLRRGDGLPFSRSAYADRWVSGGLQVFDPDDRTLWTVRPERVEAGFVAGGRGPDEEDRKWIPLSWRHEWDALQVGLYVPVEVRKSSDEATESHALTESAGAADRVRVRPIVEGDLLASTARLVDARTGEALVQHEYRLSGSTAAWVTAVAYAAELLRSPIAVVGAHAAQDPLAVWTDDLPYTAWLTGGGRRPLLALANVGLGLLLAWRARRELAGTARWRRITWTLALALGGVAFWFAYLLAEPRPAAAPVPAAVPRVLVRTREVPA